ncbi:uncharacterized protein GO595_000142 [Histomonas meleagridis]|uniref:uncharacterized protein n=1 Tax=Histomonas meleagridis TaxID=135588 RepID=UPI003559558B|nr:hypothetical protein GO595_000142 [Histomonas meleagridis]
MFDVPQYQPEEEFNPFSSPSVQQESSSQPSIVPSSEPVEVADEVEGLDSEGNSFVQRLKNCLKSIQTTIESTKKDKVTLSDLER